MFNYPIERRGGERLTVIRELRDRLLRCLNLLVRVGSNLVVRLLQRNLGSAIGVEDDLLSSSGEVVKNLSGKGEELSREKPRRGHEQGAPTSMIQVTSDIFPSSRRTATAIPSSWVRVRPFSLS